MIKILSSVPRALQALSFIYHIWYHGRHAFQNMNSIHRRRYDGQRSVCGSEMILTPHRAVSAWYGSAMLNFQAFIMSIFRLHDIPTGVRE